MTLRPTLALLATCAACTLHAAPPATPGTPTARPGTGTVGLTWPAVTDATRYNVHTAPSAAGPFTLATQVPYPRAILAHLPAGVPIHTRITALNAANEESPPSASATATPDALPLPRPATAGNFRIGSSFVTDADRLQRFLTARGLNVPTHRYQIIGAGLEYIYNHNRVNQPATHTAEIALLQGGNHDALVLNAQRPTEQGERELDGTLLFATDALAANPRVRVFIHEYWRDDGGGGVDYPWDDDGTNRERMRQWNWLASVALAYEATRLLGTPVFVAPIGSALEHAKSAAVSGQLAVTNARSGFHSGDAHLNELGKYVQEAVVAAGAYRIDVRGTSTWVSSSLSLSAADAAVLQGVAHDTVRATPFSGWHADEAANLAAHLEQMRAALAIHEGFEALPTLASPASGTFTNPRSGLVWTYSGATSADGFYNTPLQRTATRLERKLRLAPGGTLAATFPRGLVHFTLRLRQVSGGTATLRLDVDGAAAATFTNASTNLSGREARDLEAAPGTPITLTNTGTGIVELDDLIWDEPVASPSGMAILTADLVYLGLNAPFARQLAASGAPGIVWSLTSGSLPPGVTLSPTGLLAGTPTTTGASTFTLRAADAADPARFAERTYLVSVVTGTVIQQHPASRTVLLGAPATFEVAAVGTNLVYEWFRNGSLLPGGNAPTFTIASVSLLDAGSYTVRVTGSGGVATSEPAVLTVDSGGADVLTTVFNGGNLNLGGNTFDLTNTGTQPVVLTGALQGNFNAVGGLRVSAWWRTGTASGFATSASGWTAWGTSAPFTGNGYGTATSYNLGATLTIPPGETRGIYLLLTSGGTNLAYLGSSVQYVRGPLRLTPHLGLGGGAPFAAQTFGPSRLYNGSIEFYVDTAPDIQGAPPPHATVGVPYDHAFTAPGGNGAPVWTLAGTLPAGLAFNAATARISGMPQAAGSPSLTLTATDTDGDASVRAFTLTVRDPFADWLAAQGLPPGSAPGDDASASGATLLLRHALGLPGSGAPGVGMPRSSMDGGSPLLTFTRNTAATGVRVRVERSTNLATWEPAYTFQPLGETEAAAFVRARTPLGGGVEQIVLQTAPPGGAGTTVFFRITVEPAFGP